VICSHNYSGLVALHEFTGQRLADCQKNFPVRKPLSKQSKVAPQEELASIQAANAQLQAPEVAVELLVELAYPWPGVADSTKDLILAEELGEPPAAFGRVERFLDRTAAPDALSRAELASH
jgi:hypothetical protein